MAISKGERIPDATLFRLGDQGIETITTAEVFNGKKVLLFAVPGAFTPTCSASHLPSYVVHADELLAKGIDTIACLSVNDAWVLDAWGKAQNAEHILMLADGNGEFTRAVGLEANMSARGYGIRSQRYAMLVEDGVVKEINVEAPGKVEVSDAETMLALL